VINKIASRRRRELLVVRTENPLSDEIYEFNAKNVNGAPEVQGVYALYDYAGVIYIAAQTAMA